MTCIKEFVIGCIKSDAKNYIESAKSIMMRTLTNILKILHAVQWKY